MAETLLDYQLGMLRVEISTVNESIRQMDEITKSIKEWCVGIWAAATGGALVTPRLASLAGLTATIPLLFWLVDTWYRRIQRKFIWRSIQVSKFLNGPQLEASFEAGRLVGFSLLDPKNRLASDSLEYADFISWKRVMLFRSVSIFYAGMIVTSAMAGVIAYCFG